MAYLESKYRITDWLPTTLDEVKKRGWEQLDVILFSESNSRFIVEVEQGKQKEFEEIIDGIPYGCIGKVMNNDTFTVLSQNGDKVISEKISDLKDAWQATLKL